MKIKFLSFLISIIFVLGSVSFVFAVSSSGLIADSNTANTLSISYPLSSAPAGTYTITFEASDLWSSLTGEIAVRFASMRGISNVVTDLKIPSYSGSYFYYSSGWVDYRSSNKYLSFYYDGSQSDADRSYLFSIGFGSQSTIYDDPVSVYPVHLDAPSSGPIVTGSYNLPCGNTLYIDLGSSGADFDLSFDTTFNETAGGLNLTFADTYYYAFTNTIPQTSSSFTPSVGTYITMYKGNERDLFGYTKKGYGSISGTSTGRYLVIVNPLMYGKTTNIYSSTLSIYGIPSGSTIYTYPVTSSIVGSDIMSTIETTSGGIGTVSSSGGAITTYSTDNGTVVYVPNSGGNTVMDLDNSVNGYLSGLNDILNSFFNNFVALFSKPITYIQTLISSGSSFINQMSFLWSWLPSEVSSVIQSAMVVTVSVAVFKVFL